MMDKYDSEALERFASREWGKALAFLRRRYGLSDDDCKDIFQESFIALYENIRNGRLEGMTASLSTYFLSICRNKAMRFLRDSAKRWNAHCEDSLALTDGELQEEKIEELLAYDDDADDEAIVCRKQRLVRAVVKELPGACGELLWGFYRDGLSMRTLAEMLGYRSESVAKVTKHRCCEKFRKRYDELCNKLF